MEVNGRAKSNKKRALELFCHGDSLGRFPRVDETDIDKIQS